MNNETITSTGELSKNVFYRIMKWSEKVSFYSSILEMEYQTGEYTKRASEFSSDVLSFVDKNAKFLEKDLFVYNDDFYNLYSAWSSHSSEYEEFFAEKELSVQYENDDRPYFLNLFFTRPNKTDEIDVLDIFMTGKVIN